MNSIKLLAVALSMAISGSAFAQTVPVGTTNGNPNSLALGQNSLADCYSTFTDPNGVPQPVADICTAIGANARATGTGATAVGYGANASGVDSLALGRGAVAGYSGTDAGPFTGGQIAVGSSARVDGLNSTNVGSNSAVTGNHSVNVGQASQVDGELNSNVGNLSRVNGSYNSNVGGQSVVTGQSNVSAGQFVSINANRGVGLGSSSSVTADQGVAIGSFSSASALSGVAIGASSSASGTNCVALGANSSCTETNIVSLGADLGNGSFIRRRITNVAYGTNNFDAAAVGQLRGVSTAIGGGSFIDINGNYVAPTLTLTTGNVYRNLTGAIYEIDRRLAGLENATPVTPVDPVEPTPQPSGSTVVAGRNIEVQSNEDGTTSVMLSDNVELSAQGRLAIQGGPSMDANGINAAGRRITGVAAGEVSSTSTDAVNGSQLWALESDMNDKWEQTNRRVASVERRLNGIGAQAAAMSQMAMSGGYNEIGEASLQMGVGFYGQETAIAIGWKIRTSERIQVSGGLSKGGSGTKVSGGLGMSIRLGR